MTKRQVLESQVQLDDSGQILIPTEMRKAMKVKPGDTLFLHYENASIQVRTRMQRIARAQALVRRYIPEEVSLVDGLIAERREEARRELEKGN
jgi:bifunctional DNA-binding transcriptional regulator/antitoxin component of YhaV-PrlF toxin-antitoxin module